jgi:hypothetical protein
MPGNLRLLVEALSMPRGALCKAGCLLIRILEITRTNHLVDNYLGNNLGNSLQAG